MRGRLGGAVVGAALWWAVACSGEGQPPVTEVVPDSADQVLFGVTHHITIDGIRRVRLFADTAYFYQGTQTADLHGVRVEFYSPEGRLSSTVTSREGTYEWRTQAMEARGDVVGTSPDGRRLETSILRYDRQSERISGPNSFVFDGPDQHLEGDGFTANPDLTQIEAVGPRRGRIEGDRVRRQ